MKKIFLIGLMLFSSVIYARQDSIISYDDTDQPQFLEFVSKDWVKLNEFENKELWIRNSNIESKKLSEDRDLRRVFGMIRFTDGDKKVPGVGIGVRRVYSEAVVNCFDGAVIPVTDYYTDDLSVVIKAYRHPVSKGLMMSKTAPGTLASAVVSIACDGKIPEVK